MEQQLRMPYRVVSFLSPILQQLHWLPVKFRIDFKILMLTYKAFNNQAPDYISELLTLFKPSRALRSSCQMLLVVPKTKTKLYGDRSFAASAPRLWNALPVILNHSIFLRVKLKHTCSASAVEYRDHTIYSV